MKNKFCIFILSNRRSDNIKTLDTLKKLKYKGEIYILIDDLDEQQEEYKRKYKNVITFDKKEYIKKVDTIDNFKNENIVVYARNAVYDVAEQLEYENFIVLDDDYSMFCIRYVKNDMLLSKKIKKDLEIIFDEIFSYYLSIDCKTLSLSQGGDYIGGINSASMKSIRRKSMNSFFCSTKRRVEYKGSINEDVNMYLEHGKKGDLIFQLNYIALNQSKTQKNKGGLTERYLSDGTYIKSFYSVITDPVNVKISNLNGRIHHKISMSNAFPMIISDKLKKK